MTDDKAWTKAEIVDKLMEARAERDAAEARVVSLTEACEWVLKHTNQGDGTNFAFAVRRHLAAALADVGEGTPEVIYEVRTPESVRWVAGHTDPTPPTKPGDPCDVCGEPIGDDLLCAHDRERNERIAHTDPTGTTP